MTEKKSTGLDVFDSLPSRSEDAPSAAATSSKRSVPPGALAAALKGASAPPPPPSLSKAPGSIPPPPPSLRSTGALAAAAASSVPAVPPSPSEMRGGAPGAAGAASAAPGPAQGAAGAPALQAGVAAYGEPSYADGEPDDDAQTRVRSPAELMAARSRAPGASSPSGGFAPPPAPLPPPSSAPARPLAAPPAPSHPPALQPGVLSELQAGMSAADPRVSFLPAEPPRSNRGLILAVGGAVLALLAFFVFTRGGSGSLMITVAGPGGRPVSELEVYIDGEKKCTASPCKVEGLEPGPRLVRVAAKGYQTTADQAVTVEAGKHTAHNVELASASVGTGIKALSDVPGLKLYVDGEDLGPLPQTLKDMTPGEHVVRIAGGDRYKAYEERVMVSEGQMKVIGPVKLDVLKGRASFKLGPGAERAHVVLDDHVLEDLPKTVELPADRTHTVVATKKGYARYERSISFDDGIADKNIEITMVESGGDATGEAEPHRGGGGGGTRPAAPVAAKPAGKAAAGGTGTLNINSVPASRIVLDGKPLGQTPKVGLKVAAGPHTVVLIHTQYGRKILQASVTAGGQKTVMAKFP